MDDLTRPLFFDDSSVRFEPPDTAVIVAAGRITPETVHQINMALIEHGRGKPYVLHLVDISRLDGLSNESRQATEQSIWIDASRGMALFGGSITLRIMTGSILRLHRLLNRRFSSDPVRSFNNEAQARDWLVKRRREVRRELSLPDMPEPTDDPGDTDDGPP